MNTLGQLIGILFVVGLIIRYFWWIAAAVAVVARADQQHAWTLAGDPRGTYGGADVAVTTKGNRTAAQRV
jgi:hypothetical protein